MICRTWWFSSYINFLMSYSFFFTSITSIMSLLSYFCFKHLLHLSHLLSSMHYNLLHGYGSIPIDTFLVGWTSIYQLFWGSLGTRVLTHPHIFSLLGIQWWLTSTGGPIQLGRPRRIPSGLGASGAIATELRTLRREEEPLKGWFHITCGGFLKWRLVGHFGNVPF